MKIIFVTREGRTLPGARIRCYNFARELAKYGISAEVLSFADVLGARDGAQESSLRLRDKLRLNYQGLKLLLEDKNAVFYIQRFNYHFLAPYLAERLKRNRIILDLDDREMRDNPRYHLGFYPSSKAHFLTKVLAKKSIFCVAASRFLERFLAEFNRKVYYVPSGVDTELFRPSLSDTGSERIVFCWVGTLHRKEYIENINFVLDCFSVLRKDYGHVYLEILGDGIYRQELLRLIKELGDNHVTFKGWLPPESVPAYLDTAHIGLMPVAGGGKFNLAKSPTKLFEYMAMAKPSISSAFGEAGEIISHGVNGFLAKTRDEFVSQMKELARNPSLRRQIGGQARLSVEGHYSLKVLGERLHGIIMQNI